MVIWGSHMASVPKLPRTGTGLVDVTGGVVQMALFGSDMNGISWNIMKYHGNEWNIMEMNEISWNIMEYHGISWNIMT